MAESITASLPKVSDIIEIAEEASAPAPLQVKKDTVIESVLTQAGIINWTNVQRKNNSIIELKENAQLNAAASAKVNDMFTNQYFAHLSPDGTGVIELIERFSYAYIGIGENLALGNYEDDQALVQAWMDSPGHRENILNSQFKEIGVAISKGEYEGQAVWMAVQEFGRPLSDCPQPDQNLKYQIAKNQQMLDDLRIEIDKKKAQIDQLSKLNPVYNKRVLEYNAMAKLNNKLVEETQNLVEQYNNQVAAFNECIGGG